MSKNKFAAVVLALASLLGSTLALATVKEQIQARIAPAGEVCVIGDPCAAGLALVDNGEPKTPENVYQGFCIACHGTGVNNAPKFGDAAAWAPRIAKGMDTLYESALKGFNNGAMPVKGTCVACSDDEVNAAVDYMVQAGQP